MLHRADIHIPTSSLVCRHVEAFTAKKLSDSEYHKMCADVESDLWWSVAQPSAKHHSALANSIAAMAFSYLTKGGNTGGNPLLLTVLGPKIIIHLPLLLQRFALSFCQCQSMQDFANINHKQLLDGG